jgi:hypothetical protein
MARPPDLILDPNFNNYHPPMEIITHPVVTEIPRNFSNFLNITDLQTMSLSSHIVVVSAIMGILLAAFALSWYFKWWK